MNVSEAADRIWNGYRRGEFFPPELVGRLSFDEALRVDIKEQGPSGYGRRPCFGHCPWCGTTWCGTT